jgi:dTDP-L-rhamnose 4-epimerase
MRALVTGGAGFVGSHLVDALLARGLEVRVLDSLDPQVHGPERTRPAHLQADAELRVGDVRDPEVVKRALEDVDVVFHEAALVGVGQSMYEIVDYVSTNSLGAAVLLEEVARRRDRIRKLVVASSNTVYGEGAYRGAEGRIVHPPLRPLEQLEARAFETRDEEGRALSPLPTPETKPLQPTSVYAITKRDHEEMFLAVGGSYGIPTVALRYFNIYGTRQAVSNPYTGVIKIFASRMLAGRAPLVFEDGRQSRDFVHVSDIVQANLLALERDAADGHVYNVGTGRGTSVLEVAEALAAALGFETPPEIVGQFRAGDVRHCFADTTRIERELGYRAGVSLPDGMRELLEWIREQPVADDGDRAVTELAERGLAR